MLGVGRHLADEENGEVARVDETTNEAETLDVAIKTEERAPESENATEVEVSMPETEELPASPSSATDVSGETSSSQPTAVSPEVDAESVSVEEEAESSPEVSSAEEVAESSPEVSSAVDETVTETPTPGTGVAAPTESETKGVNETANEDEAEPDADWMSTGRGPVCGAVSARTPEGSDTGDDEAPDVEAYKPGTIDSGGEPSKPDEGKADPKASAAALSNAIPPPSGY